MLRLHTDPLKRGFNWQTILLPPLSAVRSIPKPISSPYGHRDRAMPSAGWGVATGSAKMLLLTSRASSRTARTRRCARRLIGCVRIIPFRAAFLRHGVTILITGPSLDQTATTPTKRASSRTFTSRGSITSGTSELFPSPQSSTTASFPQIAGQPHPHS